MWAKLLSKEAIEKLEADVAGVDRRVATAEWSGCEDYPNFGHLSRGFTKRQALSEAQNHRCAYCGIVMTEPHPGWPTHRDTDATIDHYVPVAAGGLRIWSNEVMACRLCNQYRGAMWATTYFKRVQELGRTMAAQWAKKRQAKRAKARKREW